MKWFKHLIESGDDPDIGAVMDEFGYKGYYLFFRTLEIMSKEFNYKNPGENSFNFQWFLGRFPRNIDRKTLKKFLNFMEKRERIYYKINGKEIWLKCPKHKNLADDYTQRMIRQEGEESPKYLRSESEQTPSHKNKNKNKNKNKEEELDKNLKEKPCPKSEPSDADTGLVKRLVKRILENNPKARIPKSLDGWLKACRLMREQDNRTPGEIDAMIQFSQNDQFWRSNILSMPKLREKFDQLWLKARRTRYDGIAAFVRGMEEKNGRD